MTPMTAETGISQASPHSMAGATKHTAPWIDQPASGYGSVFGLRYMLRTQAFAADRAGLCPADTTGGSGYAVVATSSYPF